MKLYEFYGPLPDAASSFYYSPPEDVLGAPQLGDTRKGRLTLRDLNRMKRRRAATASAEAERQKLIAIMYRDPEAELEAEKAALDLRREKAEMEAELLDLAAKSADIANAREQKVLDAATATAKADLEMR
jgi:hypothetical protein